MLGVMTDLVAFNTAFAGAFGGTVAALLLVWVVRYGMTFRRDEDIPAWVYFTIATLLGVVGVGAFSALT